MSLADLVQLISSTALVVTVLVLAWQTRQVASATRLASKTAVANAMSDAANNVRAVFEALLEHPELRQYICDGAPMPTEGILRSRAQTLCEMMCDAAEASLEVASQVPGADQALRGWPDWARWLLDSSPGSRHHVLAHPAWYPRLLLIHSTAMAP
jgi:hypothetical protein